MALNIRRFKRSIIIIVVVALLSVACGEKNEPTKASESLYNRDELKAATSRDLTKADLAWHAQNSYGWDCPEVISRGEMTSGGYFFIECSSGKKLRVYPRPGQHPKITNENGGYK